VSLTLFCSEPLWQQRHAEWMAVAPGLEAVTLGDGEVPAERFPDIDIAFFSGDVWPGRSANFMAVALQAANLRWLHVFNAGVDHPVFGMFRERGVRLTTSSGASATPIAHTVVLQLLAMSRRADVWHRDQQAHRWQHRDVVDLEGRVLGVVGLGAIGTEVARIGAALGMRVIGMRRTPIGDEPCETWTTDRLHELLPLVDDLVLTAPLTPETHHLIGARELAMLRPTSTLTNVGRGELIDEPALVDALRNQRLAGAALDVFTVEPLPADSPLWDMPGVLITPHSAGTTVLSRTRAVEMFGDNLRRYVAGEPLRNEVR
jgi:phosphoglycerate dehydrogenase-like enzyme